MKTKHRKSSLSRQDVFQEQIDFLEEIVYFLSKRVSIDKLWAEEYKTDEDCKMLETIDNIIEQRGGNV